MRPASLPSSDLSAPLPSPPPLNCSRRAAVCARPPSPRATSLPPYPPPSSLVIGRPPGAQELARDAEPGQEKGLRIVAEAKVRRRRC